MLNTVLLPTDLSTDQEAVIRFCAGLSDLGVRRVVVSHVIDATGLEGPVIAAKVDAARTQLQRATQPLRANGMEVELRVPTGDPERELLLIAAEEHVDAVVCGTSGKTAAGRLFVGSVSERLARDGGIPSLTVRYDLLRTAEDEADIARRFARVLLTPTDFSGTAARALNLALSLPRKAVGSVRIFNVVPGGPEGARGSKQDSESEAQLRALVGIAKERGIQASAVVGHGSPEKAILTEIQHSGITGIVVGSRGRSIIQEAIMGSVSMTLMRQAPCPVLIVP
jgi:nucleotide-binding universal stress UspA family protein